MRRFLMLCLTVVFAVVFLYGNASGAAQNDPPALAPTKSTRAQGAVPKGKRYEVAVSSALRAAGVRASYAVATPGAAEGEPAVIVYLNFTNSFNDTLTVRGYMQNGDEAARSRQLSVNTGKDHGGPLTFHFPVGTELSLVKRMLVIHPDAAPDPIPAPAQRPQPPRKESFGEEAGSILKELTR